MNYSSKQGGLNKKEITTESLYNIFHFDINLFIRLMTLNRVKLWCAVTFIKYLASVVSLIFLPKTSNLLNLAELAVNELPKSISKNNYQYYFFHSNYHYLL